MKKLILSGILICIMLLSGCSQKSGEVLRVLQHTQKKFQQIKTLSGNMEIRLGASEPGTDLTIVHLTGQMHLKKVPIDSLAGWYVANEFKQKEDSDGYKAYYAGDSLVYFWLKDSVVEKITPEEITSEWGFSEWKECQELVDLLISRLQEPDSVFGRHEKGWLVGEVTLGTDTLIQGQKCYIVENCKEDSIPGRKVKYCNFERLIIDKDKVLPVYYYKHFKRYVDGEMRVDQICWTTFFNLKIDNKLSDSLFVFKGKEKKAKIKTEVTLVKGDRVPDWRLPSVTGDTISLYNQKGKLIILDFGHFACGACVNAMREIKNEVLDCCDRSKFVFIYINLLDSWARMWAYVKDMKVDYPMVKADESLGDLYNVEGYPRIFILSPDFRIRQIIPGYYEGMGKDIRKFIEEMTD